VKSSSDNDSDSDQHRRNRRTENNQIAPIPFVLLPGIAFHDYNIDPRNQIFDNSLGLFSTAITILTTNWCALETLWDGTGPRRQSQAGAVLPFVATLEGKAIGRGLVGRAAPLSLPSPQPSRARDGNESRFLVILAMPAI
jgi:hypothetical protein